MFVDACVYRRHPETDLVSNIPCAAKNDTGKAGAPQGSRRAKIAPDFLIDVLPACLAGFPLDIEQVEFAAVGRPG
jgi:hypothetical protein